MCLKDNVGAVPNGVLAPINNDSLVNRIIDTIVQAIVDGKFKVGEKLPSEYELISELGVGRNSLREAIKILSTLGVVTIKRGSGTYVCSQVSPNALDPVVYSIIFSATANKEMLELRRILDREICRLVIERASDKEIAALSVHMSAIREAYENNDIRQVAHLDNQFHVAIANLSQNPYLAKIAEGVYRVFNISIEVVNRDEEAFNKTETCHKMLIECLKNREIDALDAIIDLSLSSWKNFDH